MILCVGTTPTVQRTMVFNRVELDDVNRAVEVVEYASGKGVNVARVVRTMGQSSLAIGFAGGRRGDFLLEDMRTGGIALDFVPTATQTRLCTTVIDRAQGIVTELVEESPASTAAEWDQLIARIEAHIPRASAAVFSGTLAPGAPADFLARWVAPGRRVVLDAKGDQLRRAMAADGWVIGKLNRSELAHTLQHPIDTDADLRRAMQEVAPRQGWLVVTMGKDGALALADGKWWRVHTPAVQAVSPIGSGDAFTAGMVLALDQGPAEALRWGAACGAANALTPNSGWLDRAEAHRLLTHARVEQLPPP